jgi:hypothetical protein
MEGAAQIPAILTGELGESVREYESPMSMLAMKASYYQAASPLKGRDSSGRARKVR